MIGRPHRPGLRRARRPFAHWLAFGLALAALAVSLLVTGFVDHRVGRSGTALATDSAGNLGPLGPTMYRSGHDVAFAGVPEGKVALTFDDGPDHRWTPEILDVLAKHHAHATFFVVGTSIPFNSNLVRRELAAGHDVGSHTFTHANLSAVSSLRRRLELSLTQTALAGATGRQTTLLRLPYSSSVDGMSKGEFRAAAQATGLGYTVVEATNDSKDWQRPGVPRIYVNSLPQGTTGAIVMMHDAGGDRSQTVQALDALLTTLESRGDRLVSMSELLGEAPSAANPRAGFGARIAGWALLLIIRLSTLVAKLIQASLIPLGLLAVARAAVAVVLAHRHKRSDPHRLDDFPSVVVVIPAYNEEVGIAEAVRSIAASDYPDVEIVVVDDGSTDATAEIVEELQVELPHVTLVRQPNAGKAAALETGVRQSTAEIVVMVDGDTVFEPDTVRWLIQPFADAAVGAVSGNTKVGNRRGILGRWQHIEYVIGFNLDRRMYDVLGCMPTVPGAIGAFRREALWDTGGVSSDTLAEDTDLTMAINRAGWKVAYEERARAWTEAPSSISGLWKQRYRWCYGTMQAMWKHRSALRDRSRIGTLAIPYLLGFQIVMPLIAPLMDIYALYGMIFLNPLTVGAYWLAFLALQLGTAVYAFRLDDERRGPLWAIPLQQFVYRQLMYLVVYESIVSALRGRRIGWNKLQRTGLSVDPRAGAIVKAPTADHS